MKVVMRYKEPGQLSSQAMQARVPVACVISIFIRLGCAPRAFLVGAKAPLKTMKVPVCAKNSCFVKNDPFTFKMSTHLLTTAFYKLAATQKLLWGCYSRRLQHDVCAAAILTVCSRSRVARSGKQPRVYHGTPTVKNAASNTSGYPPGGTG